jgi:predicted Rossmann fold flavoprotein
LTINFTKNGSGLGKNIIIAGGGAAGFFAAINIAEKLPSGRVTILEKSGSLLSKVKISGGGRCNVTNAINDPRKLVTFYPRGSKELLGAFFRFSTGNTVEWFEKRKVKLKAEDDGRMFPVTNNSQTIVDCLLNSADKAGVNIVTGVNIKNIFSSEQNGKWVIEGSDKNYPADVLVIASGNNEQMWKLLQNAGHKIEKPVPSLFAFNINDSRIKDIPGISLKNVEVKIEGSKILATGDILITHRGISGPAVLRLSAWGARELHKKDYRFSVVINWINKKTEDVKALLTEHRENNLNKIIISNPLFNVPLRLWEKLVLHAGCSETMKWQAASKVVLTHLAEELTGGCYNAAGKSTNKEEFVTCGGVNLKEVDFKTMQSRLFSNLYFAGEVLNIDAVTGGFNFQAAWTTAWIASESIAG